MADGKVTLGNKAIVRLPSGNFVNISFVSCMEVGQLSVKIYWSSGLSKFYKGEDALALIEVFDEVAGMKFVKKEDEQALV